MPIHGCRGFIPPPASGRESPNSVDPFQHRGTVESNFETGAAVGRNSQSESGAPLVVWDSTKRLVTVSNQDWWSFCDSHNSKIKTDGLRLTEIWEGTYAPSGAGFHNPFGPNSRHSRSKSPLLIKLPPLRN